MITGAVASRRARVRLVVHGDGEQVEVDAVVDTGFTGYLALPSSMVRALSLPFVHPIQALLADGKLVALPVYATAVLWHGAERDVDVIGTGTEPLLGMSLLEGSELRLQVAEGGLVTIERL